jgi:hypothetical protein
MSGPTTIMEHQPNEELAFGTSTSFAQDFGSFDRVLDNEKEPISRSCREDPIGSPFPTNPIWGSR